MRATMTYRGLIRAALLFGLVAAGAPPVAAQTSKSYTLREGTFNAGGDPKDGASPASTSYRMSLDALGDAAARPVLSSAGYRMDVGFAAAYPPPGEVLRISIAADRTTLSWTPEKSAGTYSLYRDLLTRVKPGFGTCLQGRIAVPTFEDPVDPPAGNGWFYLVTARNRLDEEGSKGVDGGGVERPNPSPCP